MRPVFDSFERFGRQWKRDTCLAVGMFDGVHRGHRAVLDLAKEEASLSDMVVAALTFPEHPASLLRPGEQPPLLMRPQEKADHLLAAGVSAVILHPFDREMSELRPREFVSYLRSRFPALRSICVGMNFRFGRNREGDGSLLMKYGKDFGMQVLVADAVVLEQLPVSSSRIREALAAGELSKVSQMLGRDYSVKGTVCSGKGLGRVMGYPTLNLSWDPEARPRYGVYAGWVKEAGSGQILPAVANYGMRPTIEREATEPVLEAHCLQEPKASIWKRGAEMSMSLNFFLRPEKKFSGASELTTQIADDCKKAKRLLSS